ncbi:MAG: zinc ABC transporter substrate-binding protein [Gammaproteobacteria bacterium]|nr:zinc ABC transporter substrate-binding protein [Gammaproteobacteria bacterium]
MIAFLVVFVMASPATAGVSVFACEPEWAALAEEIGGDRVEVTSATTALQDPHRIQARPSLIARMRRADLMICTGAGLEAGWLPLLLRKANNLRVQPGQPGYLEAATAVTLLERPQRLDRAEGDVHARGNPHIQTDPRNLNAVARLLAVRLSTIDPDNSAYFQDRLDDFLARWEAAILRWEQFASRLHGMKVVVQHNSWVYMNQWLGLEQVATIEPKPGVPPASGDMARLVRQLEQQRADVIIRAAYQDDAGAQWLSERTGIPVIVLPFTVGASPAAGDLFGLFDDTLQHLLAAAP